MVDDFPVAAQRELVRIIKKMKTVSALQRVGPKADRWCVDLRVCGAAEMKKVNKSQRDQDSVTDILSFPSGEPFFSQGYLGSLLVCLPVLKAQAREIQKNDPKYTPKNELQVLLIHGLLHLLGFDHELKGARGKTEAVKMRALEKQIAVLVMKSPKGLIDRTLIG